jgi:prepilin-type N-terminal cleavage/methylation domain-containing protein
VKGAPRGFTLLELLITLSVTTIGLIGLLSLHLSIARGNDGASRSAEAQQIGVTELETLRALKSDPLMLALGFPSGTAPPVTAAVKTMAGRAGMTYRVTRSVAALAGTTSLWRIRVETAWTDDGAVAGTNGGQLDHMLPLEVVRTLEEAL